LARADGHGRRGDVRVPQRSRFQRSHRGESMHIYMDFYASRSERVPEEVPK
jgi:hypothetical protein